MSTHRSISRTWRHGLAAACTLALLAAALPAAAFVGNLRGPKVDGELALPGLTAKVRVLRDEHGIPYIFAANTPDLIRAQGFVTVQDRLFQMEGYRAIATGRLAESIGAAGLASDRPIRLLGLRRNAERHAKLLSPEARDFLNWYAEGMNAYITGHADDHPLELKLAGFSPRPWTLEDMVTVLHFVNFSQAANFKAELNLQKLIDKFGADKVMRELLPVNVNPDRKLQPVIVGGAAGAQPLPGEGVQLLAGLDEACGAAGAAGGGQQQLGDRQEPLGQRRGGARQRPAPGRAHAARHLAPGGAVRARHPGRRRGAAGGAGHPGRAHRARGLRRDQCLRRFAGPVHREDRARQARPLCRRRPAAALPGDRRGHPHQGQGRARRLSRRDDEHPRHGARADHQRRRSSATTARRC